MNKIIKKLNKAHAITTVYVSLVMMLFITSLIFESGRTCFASSPYWNYGSIVLPCYFFDSSFKFLLNPTYFLLLFIIPTYFSSLIFFTVSLTLNSILVYFLVKLWSKWLIKKGGKKS